MPGLCGAEHERVLLSNKLIFNTIALCEAVSIRGGVHLLEHPEDPGRFPFPSIWSTLEITEMESRTLSVRLLFDQCMMGGLSKKGTCISGTADGLLDSAELRCCRTHQHLPLYPRIVNNRFRSLGLQTYPSQLCEYLADKVVRSFDRMRAHGTGPGGHLRIANVPVVRVSAWGSHSDGGTPAIAILNEDSVKRRRVIVRGQQTALYIHVDDGICIGERNQTNPVISDQLMQHCADALEDIGFVVPDRQHDSEVGKVVGYIPIRSPAQLRIPPDKSANLHESCRYLSTCSEVHTHDVRAVLGVWIWAALLRRDLLCIPHSIFSLL